MTKTLILAAGRGERMRPLTDLTPKPLLQVRGKPLMQWAMEGLARGGFTDFVVNTAWLGEHISGHFGAIFSIQPAYSLPEQLLKSEQNLNPSNRLKFAHIERAEKFNVSKGVFDDHAAGAMTLLLCRRT
jgi:N-acetyl-alpha-D-muramate 1-phosphate uridylyltransferase